jgi:hypothetical protein
MPTNMEMGMKKPKNIHLTEGAIKTLSILAIENGTNFKNYVESLLEAWAGEKKNKKKNGI